jgi:26S proteasome regulatory subunit T5
MQIHSRKMNTNKDVNFEELARRTDDFNGAQCKAVCIEAVCITIKFIIRKTNCFCSARV